MSIKLYHADKKSSVNDLNFLIEEVQKNASSEVDLYKITPDLYMFLANSPEPFENEDSIESKILMGNPIPRDDSQEDPFSEVGFTTIGLLTNDEIKEVYQWILNKELNSETGFFAHYENLDEEVKEMIEGFGSEVDELYRYFQKLAALYEKAFKDNLSVIVTVEG